MDIPLPAVDPGIVVENPPPPPNPSPMVPGSADAPATGGFTAPPPPSP